KAHAKHKDGQTTGLPEKQQVIEPDPQAAYRNLGHVLAYLQHDSPERKALLQKLGIEGDLAAKACVALSRSILMLADEDQPGRFVGKDCEYVFDPLGREYPIAPDEGDIA